MRPLKALTLIFKAQCVTKETLEFVELYIQINLNHLLHSGSFLKEASDVYNYHVYNKRYQEKNTSPPYSDLRKSYNMLECLKCKSFYLHFIQDNTRSGSKKSGNELSNTSVRDSCEMTSIRLALKDRLPGIK